MALISFFFPLQCISWFKIILRCIIVISKLHLNIIIWDPLKISTKNILLNKFENGILWMIWSKGNLCTMWSWCPPLSSRKVEYLYLSIEGFDASKILIFSPEYSHLPHFCSIYYGGKKKKKEFKSVLPPSLTALQWHSFVENVSPGGYILTCDIPVNDIFIKYQSQPAFWNISISDKKNKLMTKSIFCPSPLSFQTHSTTEEHHSFLKKK